MSMFGVGNTAKQSGEVHQQHQEEFPTIREQDLAIILGDWLRMKVSQPPPTNPGEVDALDFTVIVAELSRGLHPHSLTILYNALPPTDQWAHLRQRLEQLLKLKRA
jgi:hypothetical protein